MAPAIASTVVDRPALEVFAYATDPARFREWQQGNYLGIPLMGLSPVPASPAARARVMRGRRPLGASLRLSLGSAGFGACPR